MASSAHPQKAQASGTKGACLLKATALAFASRLLVRPRAPATPADKAHRAQPSLQAKTVGGGSAHEPGRGCSADTHAQIPAKGWKGVAWRVYEQIGKDRVLAVAVGVTFHALLSVFP